jgi:hypothetical protein
MRRQSILLFQKQWKAICARRELIEHRHVASLKSHLGDDQRRVGFLTDNDRHTDGVHMVNGPQIAHRLAGLHYVTRVISNFVSRSWVEQVSLIGELQSTRLT